MADSQASRLTVGIRIPREQFQVGTAALRAAVADVVESGIDRVCVGDHVSFHGGTGFDGLVQATALAALCDLQVQTAVYLLPLRHPVAAGTAGLLARRVRVRAVRVRRRRRREDPAEMWACGVDPTTRGRRMDESLAIVRALLAGERVTHHGTFFDLDDVALAADSRRSGADRGGRAVRSSLAAGGPAR